MAYQKVKDPYGQSAAAQFRNFLRSLKKETIQDKTVLELIKQSKSGITQTGALNIFTEEEFKNIRPLRELLQPDKIKVEKLLKGKIGRTEPVTYKGEEWYRGSDGRIRIKRELTLEEKLTQSKKAALAHEKTVSKFGAFPTGTRDPAKRLWYDLYDSHLKTKIRDPKDPRTITKSRLQLANYKNTKKWNADIAYNKLKFYDPVTKQTFNFKGLENFMEKNIGKGSYEKLLEPYKQKIFLNTTYGKVGDKAVSLRYALNEALVPGWNASDRLRNTFEIHHPYGKAKNPFSAHLAFFDTNAKEYRLRSNLFKKLENAKTLTDKKQVVGTFINEVPKGILTAPGKKVYGEVSTFEDLLKQAKKRAVGVGDVKVKTIMESSQFKTDLFNVFNKSLTTSQKNKTAIALGCVSAAEGGRIGYALGTATLNCVNTKLTNDPVQSSMRLRMAEGVGKIKPAATNFLKLLGRGGLKAAPYAAVAALGAVAEPLVKQFRNDDYSTYLSDENQQKGMLLAMVEAETPKVDQEILKWKYPGEVGAVAAGAIPGSATLYKQRRALRPQKLPGQPAFIGPMPKGVGKARAALGISGVLGKALGATFSPLAVAATLPFNVAAQRSAGTDYSDIVADPMTWMGPAFASTGAEMATKGIKNPMLLRALRLGFSPGALRMGSRFLGLPGLAFTGAMWGYDKYKNWGKDSDDEFKVRTYKDDDD